MRALVGVFVGGQSRRMGGAPKGLLPTPDSGEPIVVRIARVVGEALPDAELVLVGNHAAYHTLPYARLLDAPDHAGPIAGLIALLEAARERERVAIAIAGDMPRVTAALVRRLAEHAPDSDVVAARIERIWQPLFARYAPDRALPVARASFAPFRVLEALGAVALPLSDAEAALLVDWDTPEDVKAR